MLNPVVVNEKVVPLKDPSPPESEAFTSRKVGLVKARTVVPDVSK